MSLTFCSLAPLTSISQELCSDITRTRGVRGVEAKVESSRGHGGRMTKPQDGPHSATIVYIVFAYANQNPHSRLPEKTRMSLPISLAAILLKSCCSSTGYLETQACNKAAISDYMSTHITFTP